MKKKILCACAVILMSSYCQTSTAASSVTLYGVIDQGIGRLPGSDKVGLMQGLASRLGFRGTEDLQNGFKVDFQLEARFNPETGAQTAPRYWHGASWVGVSWKHGHFRAGRFVTSSYEMTMVPADPFSHVRVGSLVVTNSGGPISPYRFDNSVQLQLNGGGFTFSTTYSDKADTIATDKVGEASSTAVGYKSGLWDVAVGYEDQGRQHDRWTSGLVRYGDHNWRVSAFIGDGRNRQAQDMRSFSLGLTAKLGPGNFMTAWGQLKNKTAHIKVQDRFAVGYHYFLSKRTRLYADIAHDRALANNKTGFDFGIQHNF